MHFTINHKRLLHIVPNEFRRSSIMKYLQYHFVFYGDDYSVIIWVDVHICFI